MASVTLKIGIKFPWWWKPYVAAVVTFHNWGLIAADAEIAAEFVVRHSWLYTTDTKGRRRYVPIVPR